MGERVLLSINVNGVFFTGLSFGSPQIPYPRVLSISRKRKKELLR